MSRVLDPPAPAAQPKPAHLRPNPSSNREADARTERSNGTANRS